MQLPKLKSEGVRRRRGKIAAASVEAKVSARREYLRNKIVTYELLVSML